MSEISLSHALPLCHSLALSLWFPHTHIHVSHTNTMHTHKHRAHKLTHAYTYPTQTLCTHTTTNTRTQTPPGPPSHLSSGSVCLCWVDLVTPGCTPSLGAQGGGSSLHRPEPFIHPPSPHTTISCGSLTHTEIMIDPLSYYVCLACTHTHTHMHTHTHTCTHTCTHTHMHTHTHTHA